MVENIPIYLLLLNNVPYFHGNKTEMFPSLRKVIFQRTVLKRKSDKLLMGPTLINTCMHIGSPSCGLSVHFADSLVGDLLRHC